MRPGAVFPVLLLLTACGGGGSSSTPTPSQPNQAPSFTSPTAVSVTENGRDAYRAVANDPEKGSLTYSISGGADAARFSLSSAGLLSFLISPSFETPEDADGDNVYVVQLSVSDGQLSDTITVQISVTDTREGIQVRRVGAGFDQPLYVAPIPGDTRVFVLEKGGNIMILDPSTGSKGLFAAVSDISTDGERGLLGLAASPTFQTDDTLFVFVTNTEGDLQIRTYHRGLDGRGYQSTIAPVVLQIEHSEFSNNNGGWLGFGPDGDLYIATGDGGGDGDPRNNAQDPFSLLGKVLRLTRNPDPYAGAAPVFWIPSPDNPFANGGGAPEVFAYGLRNPFRASFHNGELLIGDVGQDMVEEVDLLRPKDAGANFGWPFREGTRAFRGNPPTGLVDPVTQYLHGAGPKEGGSITGGYVYRGPVDSLVGHYVFGDFVSGNIWTVTTGLLRPGEVLASNRYELRNSDFTPDRGSIDRLVSFGEDAVGNLYIVDFDGEIFIVGKS